MAEYAISLGYRIYSKRRISYNEYILSCHTMSTCEFLNNMRMVHFSNQNIYSCKNKEYVIIGISNIQLFEVFQVDGGLNIGKHIT